MKWNAPDVEGLVKFLVEEKSFSEERIRKTAEKIDKSRGKASQGMHACAVLLAAAKELVNTLNRQLLRER